MAGTLSGGEQQMLAMARALATDYAVLLIQGRAQASGRPAELEEQLSSAYLGGTKK